MATLRSLAVPIGVVAAVLLFLLVNPWITLEGAVSQAVTVAFWLAFILLLVALFEDRKDPAYRDVEVEGPAFTGSRRAGTRSTIQRGSARTPARRSWASGRARSRSPRRVGRPSPTSGIALSFSS
jgi:hypothetical protein